MNSLNNLRSLGRTDMKVTPIGFGCWQPVGSNDIPGEDDIAHLINISNYLNHY